VAEGDREDIDLRNLLRGLDLMGKKREAYDRAEKFARGETEEYAANNNNIERMLSESGRHYQFKLAAVPIRTMRNRCRFGGVDIEPSAMTTTWDEIAKANDLQAWVSTWITKSLELGDAYVLLSKRDTDEEPAPELDAPEPEPLVEKPAAPAKPAPLDAAKPTEDAPPEPDDELDEDEAPATDDGGVDDSDIRQWGITAALIDPRNAIVVYDDMDERRPLYGIVTWEDEGQKWAQLHYRNRILTYASGHKAEWRPGAETDDKTSRDYVRPEMQGQNWELTDLVVEDFDEEGELFEETIPHTQENPYREIALKHLRTALPYGVPVHEDAYGPQNLIAKLITTHACGIDAQGWPGRYGLVDPAGQLDGSNEQVDWDDDADIPAQPVRRIHQPGVIQYLEGLKEVGQWDSADPAVFTDPIEMYLSLMSVVTETPLYSFQPGGEQPSGKAREIADAPMNFKVEQYQTLAEIFFKELTMLAMFMATGRKPRRVEVKWAPGHLASSEEDWRVVAQKQTAGVPKDVTLQEVGYDPAVVEEWQAGWEEKEIADREAARELAGMPPGGPANPSDKEIKLPPKHLAAEPGKPSPKGLPVKRNPRAPRPGRMK